MMGLEKYKWTGNYRVLSYSGDESKGFLSCQRKITIAVVFPHHHISLKHYTEQFNVWLTQTVREESKVI